jgi:hypothetical protein
MPDLYLMLYMYSFRLLTIVLLQFAGKDELERDLNMEVRPPSERYGIYYNKDVSLCIEESKGEVGVIYFKAQTRGC